MARRAAWEDIDPAEHGPYHRHGSGQGRWLGVGLLAIGTATFVGAFYVPLYRAHDALSREHTAVVDQLESTHAALIRTQSELTRMRQESDVLRQSRDGAVAAARARADGLRRELAGGAIERLSKKDALSVSTSETAVLLSFDPASVFLSRDTVVSNAGRKAICEVIRVVGKTTSIHVHDFLTGGAPVPSGFTSSYPTAWSFTAARAAGVAEALEEDCGVPGAVLRATGDAKQDRFEAALGAGRGERLVLEIAAK